MEKQAPHEVAPNLKGPDKLATRTTIAKHIALFRLHGLKTGVSIVNCDTNSEQNVVGYACYINELCALGCTVLAISALAAQLGMIRTQVVTQFIITYSLPDEP